ncbi:UNVERIFIED_CONTAM: hypothetical protein FKN15_075886 [Acipenser sinensis]
MRLSEYTNSLVSDWQLKVSVVLRRSGHSPPRADVRTQKRVDLGRSGPDSTNTARSGNQAIVLHTEPVPQQQGQA